MTNRMTNEDKLVAAWLAACDAIDKLYPIERIALRIEAQLIRIITTAKRVATEDLPADVAHRICKRLDDYLAIKQMELAEWSEDELRSNRMARAMGCIIIRQNGYVTTGETNWLTHPEMHGVGILMRALINAEDSHQ